MEIQLVKYYNKGLEDAAKMADDHRPSADPIGPLHYAGREFAASNIAKQIRKLILPE